MKANEFIKMLDQVEPDLIWSMEEELVGRNSHEGNDVDFVKNLEQKIALRNHAPFFIETLKAHLELLLDKR